MTSFEKVSKITELSKLLYANKITDDEFRKLAIPMCDDEMEIVKQKMESKVEEIINDKRSRDLYLKRLKIKKVKCS